MTPGYSKNTRLLVGVLIALMALAGGATVVFWWRIQEVVREESVRRLEEHFNATAQLESLTLSIFPVPRLIGREVFLRHKGRTDIPPLIRIDRFTADLSPWGLLADPIRVDRVELVGLEIQIASEEDDDDREKPRDHKEVDPLEAHSFVIGEIKADGTRLTILPVDGDPLVFDIRKLYLESVGLDHAMEFEAELVNAKPPGWIQSTGRLGPWNAEDPGGTTVEGEYRFDDADLSVFSGISGFLSSTGTYAGHLSRIEIDGSTDTPDFQVGEGQAVHLTADFHAVVDGTSGDTLLDPVRARFLRTSVTARGGVVEWEEGEGKAIRLDVTLDRARVEDLIALVLAPDTPLLTGDIQVKTDFQLPAGERDVIDRLRLDGEFSLTSAEFGRAEVRSQVEELSWRARGRPDEDEDRVDRVVSHMRSRFVLDDAKIRFEGLTFEVPGARALLDGTHELHRGTLDFKGELRMEASVSQAVGGFRSFLLKMVDPFLRSGGDGAVISIKVDGTIDDPNFGVGL